MKLVASLTFLSVLTFLSLNQRHGANADSTCPKNCRPYEGKVHCNKTTGKCSEGCNVGFYGSNCECTCHCGGGPCVGADGTCMETSSPKPVPVFPGHNQDCQTVGYIVVICLLCFVCVAIIAAGILIHRIKTKRLLQRSSGQRSDGPEGHPLISGTGPSLTDNASSQTDNAPSQTDTGPSQPDTGPSQPPQLMPQTEKDHLAYDMGVHVLYHSNEPNKPVFLYCVHMKYDYRRVNTSTAHITRERYLVSEPEIACRMDQFPERFKTFSGTTSLSPTIHGDVPTYWEVNCNVQLEDQLKPTDVLLCIGFCREMERNEDDCPQTPFGENCYNLNVGISSEHEQICSKIYRGKTVNPITIKKTDIKNKKGQTGDLNYGILVCKGKKVIVYFDLAKMERIDSLENVDFERPLWPMFGVIKKSVSMLLVTGRDIDMTPKKTDMIVSALPSV